MDIPSTNECLHKIFKWNNNQVAQFYKDENTLNTPLLIMFDIGLTWIIFSGLWEETENTEKTHKYTQRICKVIIKKVSAKFKTQDPLAVRNGKHCCLIVKRSTLHKKTKQTNKTINF